MSDSVDAIIAKHGGKPSAGDIVSKYGGKPTGRPDVNKPSGGFGEAVLNFGVGAAKGLGHTALNLSKFGQFVSDPFGIEKRLFPEQAKAQEKAEAGFEKQLEPTGTAQKVGYGAEQVGEFFVPIPGLAEIKPIAGAGRLERGIVTAARTGLDVGAKTAIQTGSVKQGLATGAIAGPVGAAAEVGIPAISNLLKKAAASQYAKVIHPLGRRAKEVAMEHIPEVLETGYKGAAAGSQAALLDKFSSRTQELGKQLEAEYAKLDATTQTKLKPIYDDFGKWMDENAFTKIGTIKDPAIWEAGFKKMQEIQRAIGPYAENAAPSTVWEVRQALDKYVYKNGLTADEAVQAGAMTREAFANSIRGQLNSQHTTVSELNESFHLWRSLAELQQRNVNNEFGKFQFARNAGVIGRFLMGASVGGGEAYHAGGTPWEIGGAAVLLGLALESPAWRTVSAVSKVKIANMLAAGEAQTAANTAARLTGVALKQAQP
jgi:hypothetical protein